MAIHIDLQLAGYAVHATLSESAAAQELAAHLPLTLRMSGTGIDLTGQLPFSLPCGAADVHPGWSDGDLNYKPEGDWLALFFDDERNSARYGGQVTLGHAVGSLDALRGPARTCEVRIEALDGGS